MTTRRPPARLAASVRARIVARRCAACSWLVAGLPAPPTAAAEPPSAPPAGGAGLRPTVQYEEALAHADDRIAFTPGGRVTVPFKPAAPDRWTVDGVHAARAAGRPVSGHGDARDAPTAPARRSSADRRSTDAASIRGRSAPVDLPYARSRRQRRSPAQPRGRGRSGRPPREVFGFLPYWELTDSSTRLDWEKLSTIAYFGVGADGNGQPPEAATATARRRSAGAAGRARR